MNSSDKCVMRLDALTAEIQREYRRRLQELVRPSKIQVMLGDSTVTEQETFDPSRVRHFYDDTLGILEGWEIAPIQETDNEDLRRTFAKFRVMEGDYLLLGHVSIQYHALLYYKPDYHVVECQKELGRLVEEAGETGAAEAEAGEAFLEQKLGEMGYGRLGTEKLFETLYNDDDLTEVLAEGMERNTGADLRRISKRKQELFNELDGLLIETYHTTDVLLDDARLVTGEEGILCTFDLDFIRAGARESAFDAREIPARTANDLEDRLDEFLRALGGNAPPRRTDTKDIS